MNEENAMSTMPVPAPRHALKLPAGSVRAIHVLGIVGLVCGFILLPSQRPIPPYLIYLLFLMLGHYFASHGVTIAARDDPSPSPLYLPGGTVRFLIVIVLLGVIGWKLYDDEAGLIEQFKNSLEALKGQPVLPLAILGGFLFGVIVRAIVPRAKPPAWWQDFEAWISLIALIGLTIAALIHLVVEESTLRSLELPVWDATLGAVIAFYFGERS
jgi:hypothetical protein